MHQRKDFFLWYLTFKSIFRSAFLTRRRTTDFSWWLLFKGLIVTLRLRHKFFLYSTNFRFFLFIISNGHAKHSARFLLEMNKCVCSLCGITVTFSVSQGLVLIWIFLPVFRAVPVIPPPTSTLPSPKCLKTIRRHIVLLNRIKHTLAA